MPRIPGLFGPRAHLGPLSTLGQRQVNLSSIDAADMSSGSNRFGLREIPADNPVFIQHKPQHGFPHYETTASTAASQPACHCCSVL